MCSSKLSASWFQIFNDDFLMFIVRLNHSSLGKSVKFQAAAGRIRSKRKAGCRLNNKLIIMYSDRQDPF